MRGLDDYITGHGGEDSADTICVSCGRRFRPEERPNLHPDVDPDDVDTCSPACDSAEAYRLMAEHEGDGVPFRQTEANELLNGGWRKGKR